MPVILPENQFDSWLSGEAGKEILVPYPADQMTAWPVSPRVNSHKNNDPGILEPIVGDAQITSARVPGRVLIDLADSKVASHPSFRKAL
jgi:hypothetical protein